MRVCAAACGKHARVLRGSRTLCERWGRQEGESLQSASSCVGDVGEKQSGLTCLYVNVRPPATSPGPGEGVGASKGRVLNESGHHMSGKGWGKM
eukprot:415810-Pyramimonas_sp.AAC.1